MIGRTIGRLLLVPFALLCAALISMLVLMTLGQERLLIALRGNAAEDALFDLMGLFLKLMLSVFSVQTVLLPLLVVIAGEVARIRSAAFYVAGLGIAVALIPIMARMGNEGALAGAGSIWTLFATAGFAGGFIYWLIAGRSA